MKRKSQKHSILLIDDKPNNLRLLSEILVKKGYEVRKALNYLMAIESIKFSPPKLILLDIQMPEIDGYELCRRLKADPLTANIPIIFISIYDHVSDKVKAFASGGVDYVTKPFDEVEVVARVENQLRIQYLQEQLREKNECLEQAVANLEAEMNRRIALEKQLHRSNQDLQRANQELLQLAVLDSLTKIPNRHRFDEYFQQSWHRAFVNQEPLTLMLCDVDYFKLYNDTYGHQAGDRCLQKVAQTIHQAMHYETDLAARYGGEEFVAILPNTTLNGGIKVATRVKSELLLLAIPHIASKIADYVTLSLGIVTVLPTDQWTAQSFFMECDRCLYEAKETGRDRYIAKQLNSISS